MRALFKWLARLIRDCNISYDDLCYYYDCGNLHDSNLAIFTCTVTPILSQNFPNLLCYVLKVHDLSVNFSLVVGGPQDSGETPRPPKPPTTHNNQRQPGIPPFSISALNFSQCGKRSFTPLLPFPAQWTFNAIPPVYQNGEHFTEKCRELLWTAYKLSRTAIAQIRRPLF